MREEWPTWLLLFLKKRNITEVELSCIWPEQVWLCGDGVLELAVWYFPRKIQMRLTRIMTTYNGRRWGTYTWIFCSSNHNKSRSSFCSCRSMLPWFENSVHHCILKQCHIFRYFLFMAYSFDLSMERQFSSLVYYSSFIQYTPAWNGHIWYRFNAGVSSASWQITTL